MKINVINQKNGAKYLKAQGIVYLCTSFVLCIIGFYSLIKVKENPIYYFSMFIGFSFMCTRSYIGMDLMKRSKRMRKYPAELDVNSIKINTNKTINLFNEDWEIAYNSVQHIVLDCYLNKIILPEPSLNPSGF